ncbi:putative transposase, Ptta/En/Spm, plant [Dillenia turbinata]|uniref:Transposase, Ptta/En/Spm, plant n=1 Tax=Dillenia turbinata TaxID=194707 RepID=A0AAN8YYH5_9MAGN
MFAHAHLVEEDWQLIVSCLGFQHIHDLRLVRPPGFLASFSEPSIANFTRVLSRLSKPQRGDSSISIGLIVIFFRPCSPRSYTQSSSSMDADGIGFKLFGSMLKCSEGPMRHANRQTCLSVDFNCLVINFYSLSFRPLANCHQIANPRNSYNILQAEHQELVDKVYQEEEPEFVLYVDLRELPSLVRDVPLADRVDASVVNAEKGASSMQSEYEFIDDDDDDSLNAQYRTHRYKLHKYFQTFQSKEEALRHPPVDVPEENWNWLCEYLTSDTFKKMSERNKKNRAHNENKTFCGTKSLTRVAKEKRRTEGIEVSPIDLYQYDHFLRKTGTWGSEKAKETLLLSLSENRSR